MSRAGTGLIEIVTKPDLRSAEDAGKTLKTIQQLLRCLNVCDANLDEGEMRCDVNVSVNRIGEPWGTRCEVKNVNSIRFLMKAIGFKNLIRKILIVFF